MGTLSGYYHLSPGHARIRVCPAESPTKHTMALPAQGGVYHCHAPLQGATGRTHPIPALLECTYRLQPEAEGGSGHWAGVERGRPGGPVVPEGGE